MFEYPHGDLHELNLDWFLKEWKNFEGEFEDFKTYIRNELEDITANILPAIVAGQVKNKVEKYKTAKFLIIGDSYSLPSVTGGQTWATTFVGDLGLVDYTLLRMSGHGFYGGIPYLQTLQPWLDTLPDTEREAYDYVLVCGGANDAGVTTYSIIKTAIAQFQTAIKEALPNAEFINGFIGWTRTTADKEKFRRCYGFYKDACNELGIDFLQGVQTPLHYIPFMQNTPGNYHHPNENGSVALGHAITSAILNKKGAYEKKDIQYVHQYGTHLIPTTYIPSTIENDELIIPAFAFIYGNTGGDDAGTTPLPQNTEVKIGTLDEGSINGWNTSKIQMNGTLSYSGNLVPISLNIYGNEIYILNRVATISAGFGGTIVVSGTVVNIMDN